MTALVPNNNPSSLLARRSIIIGAAASLMCASYRACHESDAGPPVAILVWTSVCGLRQMSISSRA
jgi:hypothetical protein